MLRFLIPLLCLPLAATANPQVLSVQSGFFCNVHDTGSEAAEDTIEGHTDLFDPSQVRVIPTRIAPAALGVHIGVLMMRDPAYRSVLQVVTTHPPMGPEGATSQSFFANQTEEGQVGVGWEFEFPYELVPGSWSISILDGDTLLHRADFTVVPVAEFPDGLTICNGGPELMS